MHALYHPTDRYCKISTILFLINTDHLSCSRYFDRLSEYFVYKVCNNYTYHIQIFLHLNRLIVNNRNSMSKQWHTHAPIHARTDTCTPIWQQATRPKQHSSVHQLRRKRKRRKKIRKNNTKRWIRSQSIISNIVFQPLNRTFGLEPKWSNCVNEINAKYNFILKCQTISFAVSQILASSLETRRSVEENYEKLNHKFEGKWIDCGVLSCNNRHFFFFRFISPFFLLQFTHQYNAYRVKKKLDHLNVFSSLHIKNYKTKLAFKLFGERNIKNH